MGCNSQGISAENVIYILEVTSGFVDKFNISTESKLEIISI